MLDSCKSHFYHFTGIVFVSGSKEQTMMWEMVWFACIWVIWNARNSILFNGKKVEKGDMMEQVKLKAWLWITAKGPQFNYPYANWYSN